MAPNKSKGKNAGGKGKKPATPLSKAEKLLQAGKSGGDKPPKRQPGDKSPDPGQEQRQLGDK